MGHDGPKQNHIVAVRLNKIFYVLITKFVYIEIKQIELIAQTFYISHHCAKANWHYLFWALLKETAIDKQNFHGVKKGQQS